jgi:hypothetical protein
MSPKHPVDELREKRCELENKITDLLIKFEKETTVVVRTIHVDPNRSVLITLVI